MKPQKNTLVFITALFTTVKTWRQSKPSPNPHRLGHFVFQGHELAVYPLSGKTIKLFFSTLAQTLSLRLDSALMHRS